jgi:hypothetical protein
MFSIKLVILATSAMFISGVDATGKCNTGPIQCCKQVYKAHSPRGMQLLSEVGVNVHDVVGMVGAQCTPINVIGVSSGSHWFVFLPFFSCRENIDA